MTVATTAFQDPHRLQARPSLIAAVRNADLVVCTGADLEIGWLPLLLRRAANPKVREGSSGYFLAADFVRRLEIPKTIDRSQGDLHPQGNPHIHLDPRNIARVAKCIGTASRGAGSGQRCPLSVAAGGFPGALGRRQSDAGTTGPRT